VPRHDHCGQEETGKYQAQSNFKVKYPVTVAFLTQDIAPQGKALVILRLCGEDFFGGCVVFREVLIRKKLKHTNQGDWSPDTERAITSGAW
jgi:hypothetical protein